MSARFTNYLRKKRENPEYRKREKLAEVAADLRILLADAGLSQRELAARLALSDQALSKKLSGTNLTLGALFDYCEALGKDFDIVFRDKGARHAGRGVPAELDGAYVFNQRERVATRPPIVLRASNEAANDAWSPLRAVARA